MKRLLLVGGGHSHVEVLRRLGDEPIPAAEVVLVSPSRYTPYSGMLPGLIAGHYTFDECHIDLQRVTSHARARFEQQPMVGLDPAQRAIKLDDGRVLEFDIVSLDIGSRPATDRTSGALEHAVAVKPVETFLARWKDLIAAARAGSVREVAVVGGGAAGTEVLLSMQHRLRCAGVQPRFHLLNDVPHLLPHHGERTRMLFERVLRRRGVQVHLGFEATRVEPRRVIAVDGRSVDADVIVWATGAGAPAQLAHTGLALDARGFVAVNESLQSASHACVFAAGDVASIAGHPRPKSGVYAVRQGPPLARNLRSALAGERLASFVPQRRALALITTGDKRCVASYGALAVQGAWVWRWKDWIDRRFVRRYNAL